MASRLELHKILKELLGSENVYYQSPESIKMSYPAIKYSRSDIQSTFANNSTYLTKNRYEIIVIDKRPDNPVIEKILTIFVGCAFDRHYVADNLNHDVLTLYY